MIGEHRSGVVTDIDRCSGLHLVQRPQGAVRAVTVVDVANKIGTSEDPNCTPLVKCETLSGCGRIIPRLAPNPLVTMSARTSRSGIASMFGGRSVGAGAHVAPGSVGVYVEGRFGNRCADGLPGRTHRKVDQYPADREKCDEQKNQR